MCPSQQARVTDRVEGVSEVSSTAGVPCSARSESVHSPNGDFLGKGHSEVQARRSSTLKAGVSLGATVGGTRPRRDSSLADTKAV